MTKQINFVDFPENKGINIGQVPAGSAQDTVPEFYASISYAEIPVIRDAALAIIEGTLTDPKVTIKGISVGSVVSFLGMKMPHVYAENVDVSLYDDRFTYDYDGDGDESQAHKRIIAIGQNEDVAFFGDNSVEAFESFRELSKASPEDLKDRTGDGLVVDKDTLQELVNVLNSIIKDKNL